MTEQEELVTVESEVSPAMVALGAAVGALAGAALIYALARRKTVAVRVKPAQALKAGALLVGTMRQLAALLAEEA